MSPFETLGKGWFKCSKCGATWIKPLKPFQALGVETVFIPGRYRGKHYKARLIGKKVKK